MKKIMFMLCVFLLVFNLAGCNKGGNDVISSEPNQESDTETIAPSVEGGDDVNSPELDQGKVTKIMAPSIPAPNVPATEDDPITMNKDNWEQSDLSDGKASFNLYNKLETQTYAPTVSCSKISLEVVPASKEIEQGSYESFGLTLSDLNDATIWDVCTITAKDINKQFTVSLS